MKSNNTTFERARGLVKGCLFAAVAFCVIGLLINSSSETLAMYAAVTAVILMAVALIFVAMCLKCPYCGKHIIVKCLTVKSCPHCGRDLVSGMKVKGKGKKKR